MAQRQALAALVLGCALFAWALPASRLSPQDCAYPSEAAAVQGDTTAVQCVADPAEVAALRGPARRLFGLPLDLNCARAATLESLPGIGPARARAIVEARGIRPFRRVEDLTRVPGIGPKTLARLRSTLSVRHPIAAAASVDSAGCLAGIRDGRDGPEARW